MRLFDSVRDLAGEKSALEAYFDDQE